MPITKDTPEVQIEVFIEPEEMEINGNASAVDPVTDAEAFAWIRDQLDRGNEWAWCSVKVEVRYNDIVATEYLGGCSYRDEKEFRDGGYFDQMVSECLDTINAELTVPTCAIQWIVPALGDKPTPDANPAVVMIQCMTSEKTPIPCCADHLARMPRNWRVTSIVRGGYDATEAQTRNEQSAAALILATDQLHNLGLPGLKALRARVEERIDWEVSAARGRASRR